MFYIHAPRVLFPIIISILMFSGLAAAQDVKMLSAAEMFEFADYARRQRDFLSAEKALHALTTNQSLELRTEAHFRLALLLADDMHRYREAAAELRQILDEKPRAARVRLELARVAALAGELVVARRELRAAEAGGLPTEIERSVRFYAAALKARKRFGGSIELAVAPDSNINRTTRSDTIGTVIGNFTLDSSARAHSGIGLLLRGQVYDRIRLGQQTNFLVRVDSSAALYRDAEYNDVTVGLFAGPEWTSGTDRFSLSSGPTWRWYGTAPYSGSLGTEAAILHPMGRRAQGRLALGLARTINRRNALQSATTGSAAISADYAFTSRFSGGVSLAVSRTAARDPGWSDVTAGISAYAFRDFGRATAVLSLGYTRVEGDARLAVFPRRRVDDHLIGMAAVTWRKLQWKGFAPVTRARWEHNRSTVDLYAFTRIAAEIGIASAF